MSDQPPTLASLTRASVLVRDARTERDQLICAALNEGHTLRAVGCAAGLSHTAVATIRDRRAQQQVDA